MLTFFSVIAALSIRDSVLWVWKRERRRRKTAENVAGMHRFLERQAALASQDRAVK